MEVADNVLPDKDCADNPLQLLDATYAKSGIYISQFSAAFLKESNDFLYRYTRKLYDLKPQATLPTNNFFFQVILQQFQNMIILRNVAYNSMQTWHVRIDL